jgi:hypothetical protein
VSCAGGGIREKPWSLGWVLVVTRLCNTFPALLEQQSNKEKRGISRPQLEKSSRSESMSWKSALFGNVSSTI